MSHSLSKMILRNVWSGSVADMLRICLNVVKAILNTFKGVSEERNLCVMYVSGTHKYIACEG